MFRACILEKGDPKTLTVVREASDWESRKSGRGVRRWLENKGLSKSLHTEW